MFSPNCVPTILHEFQLVLLLLLGDHIAIPLCRHKKVLLLLFLHT